MLLKDQEAAKYLGLSVSTLRQWRLNPGRTGFENPPPFIKLGHAVRYRKEDLDRWIEQNTHGGAA